LKEFGRKTERLEEEVRSIVSKTALMIAGLFLVSAAGTVLAQPLHVYNTYGFYNITNNNPTNAATGEEQLFVDVANGNNQVTFRFRNEGPSPCSITDVYFDDGTLLELIGIIDVDDGIGHCWSL